MSSKLVAIHHGAVLLTDGLRLINNTPRRRGSPTHNAERTRVDIFDSQDIELERAKQPLDMVGELCVIEGRLHEQERTGEAQTVIRQREAKPSVNNSLAGCKSSSTTGAFVSK